MARMRVIDADGHIFEDSAAIARRLPAPWEPARLSAPDRITAPLDHLHNDNGRIPPGAFNRAVGPQQWVEFMDAVGIEAAVLYPTAMLAFGRLPYPDYAIVTSHAYNDWLAETYLAFSPRFRGMGLVPLQEPEAAAAELRRCVTELGMCGAMLPVDLVTGSLGAKHYYPLYQEADRLGCCLAVHGGCHAGLGMDDFHSFAPVHALGHPITLLTALAAVVFDGILDRFPRVRWGFLEGGVAWLLLALERFQGSYEAFTPHNVRGELLTLPPGERLRDYLRRQLRDGRVFVGCEGDEPALAAVVKEVGANCLLFSSDFPHEVNNDLCREEIDELLAHPDLTDAAKAGILHANAERFYRLAPVGSAAPAPTAG
ncbi:MAG TPA: amidohydrolase family protein [Chloroflexota bacterium]|nr:amidohydrolase family protein [Chloroflexota bacterium]